ncbi:SDR family NAD(P)-dependent oxidoreductase [Promicromonospora sp. NPDC090134]|uniref:SDR family NAD(P)-dependent oxidoreductase n=1 Tax=Promicromonospora sp. NPDC090134 TaxID=3364408 RepID=UPI003813B542
MLDSSFQIICTVSVDGPASLRRRPARSPCTRPTPFTTRTTVHVHWGAQPLPGTAEGGDASLKVMTSERLDNRISLITGGTTGMGLATARRLLDEGAQVIITGRDQERLDAATLTLDAGDRLLPVRADASNISDIDELMTTIGERYGRLDFVFANAGILSGRSTQDVTEEEFDRVVGVNFKGVYFTVQKAIPLLHDGASVVLNASWTIYLGRGTNALYSASKAAVHNLARTLASELAPRRIRVNSVSPGYIVTRMFDGVPVEERGAYVAEVAAGRLGTPEDIAGVIAFLASDDSAYVNGEDILVDGGRVAVDPLRPME